MSKEEKEAYLALSEEEKQKFIKEKEVRLEKIGVKITILSALLLESLEEAETFQLARKRYKKVTNDCKKESAKYLDDLFKTKNLEEKEERKNTADYIYHATKAANEDLEKLLNHIV